MTAVRRVGERRAARARAMRAEAAVAPGRREEERVLPLQARGGSVGGCGCGLMVDTGEVGGLVGVGLSSGLGGGPAGKGGMWGLGGTRGVLGGGKSRGRQAGVLFLGAGRRMSRVCGRGPGWTRELRVGCGRRAGEAGGCRSAMSAGRGGARGGRVESDVYSVCLGWKRVGMSGSGGERGTRVTMRPVGRRNCGAEGHKVLWPIWMAGMALSVALTPSPRCWAVMVRCWSEESTM